MTAPGYLFLALFNSVAAALNFAVFAQHPHTHLSTMNLCVGVLCTVCAVWNVGRGLQA